MTKDEIEEEAGILDLACAQLGNELTAGRLRAAKVVHERLGVLVRKLDRLEATAAEMGGAPSSNDGVGAPCPGPASSPS